MCPFRHPRLPRRNQEEIRGDLCKRILSSQRRDESADTVEAGNLRRSRLGQNEHEQPAFR